MNHYELEVRAENVDFSYNAKQVLRDVTVSLRNDQRVGIVGESGSGKTTIARLLAGALVPKNSSIRVNGQPWCNVPRNSASRRKIQMIFQDPYASLNPHLSVREAVREAVQVCRKLPRATARTVAEALLDSVGITAPVATRRPRQLSGGQCQRVAIARALAAEPSLIIADEPTSALDVSVQAQIINVLLDLMDSHGVGLLLVSHDLEVVRHLTDEVLVMRHGRILERGPTLQVMTEPEHAYTKQLCRSLLLATANQRKRSRSGSHSNRLLSDAG